MVAIIKRDIYLNKLISKKHNGLVKVVTGMRRCGKSYLLFSLFKQHLLDSGVPPDHITEIAFDSFENEELRDPHVLFPLLKKQLESKGMHYVLLDEVQLLDKFVAVLNGVIRLPNVDVYVTGSNARFLSHDVITEFRGRGDEIHMQTLSFAEFMSAYSGDQQKGWQEYLLYGGLPFILGLPTPNDKVTFLKVLFQETYLTDIIGRHHVRNRDELEELLRILASGIGSLTNPTKLSASFKSLKQKVISKNTIKNYLDYFTDAFLLTNALRFDVKGKKYINTPSKYYFTDLGVRNALLNFRQIEETHSMENAIFNELTLRGYNVDIGIVSQNDSNSGGNGIRRQFEIDFVCNLGSERCYIQSAYALPTSEKMLQEERPLLLAKDSFKKVIITKDSPTHYNDNGILVLNLFDFLLDPDSLRR